ncbi:MAG: HEAT repeat domain-containing protein [Anaerolineales bacterium]
MTDIQSLINNLYHPDSLIREAQGEAELRKLGVEPLDALIAVLNRTQPAPPIKRSTGLLNLGSDPHEREIEARCLAAGLLGHIEDERATEALVSALGTEEHRVRDTAALALGRRNDARAVEPLIGALQNRDMNIRAEAVELLGMLGDGRAVDPLIRTLLSDGQPIPRWKATRALGQMGDARAVRPLMKVIEGLLTLPAREWAAPQLSLHQEEASAQPVWTTCAYTLEALSKLNDPTALPIVERLAREVPARTIADKAAKCAAKLRYGHTE